MISDRHPSFAPAESATCLILPSYVIGAIACSSLTDVTIRVHRPHSLWCLTSDLPRCVGHLVPLGSLLCDRMTGNPLYLTNWSAITAAMGGVMP